MQGPEQTGSIQRFELINAETLSQEVSTESIVPDSMPDVEKILLTDGKIHIRSAAVSDGRIELDGTVFGSILYAGEGNDVPNRLEFSIPISLSGNDTELEDTDKLFINARINASEGKALNTRKVSFRVEAAVCACVFRESEADLTCELNGAEEAELLWETVDTGYISGIQERAFTVSEELPLTDEQNGISDILLYDLRIDTGEVRKVGGKMILQGNADLSILYTEEESKQIHSDHFQIPFSQIADAPEEDLSACMVSAVPSACRIEPYAGINGAKSIEAEIRLTARILIAAHASMRCVTDAYSPRYLCVNECGKADLWGECDISILKQQVKESLRVSDPVGEILYTKAECSVPFIAGDFIRIPVICSVVYKTPEGIVCAVSKRMQAEIDAPKENRNTICFGEASCHAVTAVPGNEQIDVSIEVRLPTMTAKTQPIQYLSAVRIDKESAIHLEEKPSVMVVRPNGRSLWKLAKEYSSTVDLITAANPDSVSGNPAVLIPRAR